MEVEAPNLTPGINAALTPGAEILGHVSEVGSGAPMANVIVCAEAEVGEFEDCDSTDPAGDYALRSLPAGTYLVGFGIEYLPFSDRHAAQWWQGVPLRSEATPIEITPSETRNGINAQLVNPYPDPKPESVVVTTRPKPTQSPPKCRKGFHRKNVNGKSRCVRKHKRAHSRKRRSHRAAP